MKRYKINLDKVWKHYPNPKSADEARSNDYCVGGALCQYVRKYLHIGDKQELNFPSDYKLASVLLVLNPNLTSNSDYYAKDIIILNENQEFEKAKYYVAEALEYKNEKL